VKKGWDQNAEDGNDGITISDQDRKTIKDHLVDLMSSVPPNIQAQCSASISLIAAVDFPAKWENLLPMLVQKFNSQDPSVVNGVLLTAHSIFERFCFVQRNDKLYADIIYCLTHIQAPLLGLFKATSTAVDTFQSDALQLTVRFEALRLMCCIFFCLNYQDLPEFFEDHMQEWMAEFAKYLEYQNPLLTDADEEIEPSPIDKLQSAVVEDLNLYAEKDEEPFLPFLPEFTRLVWNLLLRVTSLPKHDNLATKCIKFLASIVQKQMHKDLFKEEATLRQIVGNIVIPNLMVREVDQELFEDDPAEFIAIDMEGSETQSRRKCSQELLRAMCRQFDTETTGICYEHIGQMLGEFQNNPNEKWAAKDAAINLMFGIASKAETTANGVSHVKDASRLMEFFTSHVFPELQDSNHSTRPMVKGTAIKFVCIFRNQFSKEQLNALVPLLISHLSSPVIVVHTYAAFTLEKIMTARDTNNFKFGRNELRPHLDGIFTALFAIIENEINNENEYAMKCVMRALHVADEDILPATQTVIERLTVALGRVAKNPRNPRYNHYLFESIAVLVKSVCQKEPSATTSFESFLFPPFQTILQMDVSEFTPYVFQIFSQLLEFRQPGSGLGEAYPSLLGGCVTPSAWERKGNIPALTRLLSAYIQQAADDVVRENYFTKILGVWQKLISSKANEQCSFELLKAVVLFVPQNALNSAVPQILNIILTRLHKAKTDRFSKLVSNFFALFVGKYGAQLFFDELNKIQPSLAIMLITQVWLPSLSKNPPVRMDAKIQVVALTKVCCETSAMLGDDNARALWGRCVAASVFLLTSKAAMIGQEVTDEGTEEIEITYDSTFSALRFARKPVEDPFPEIENPSQSFVQALHSLSSNQPGVLQSILQQSLSSDPKLSAGLEHMLRNANLTIS